MVDLNSLIPRNSSLQLVNALDINDRGEIAGIGVPPGVPFQDADLRGHAFLLISCEAAQQGQRGPRLTRSELIVIIAVTLSFSKALALTCL